jgi:hypothetical protein
VWTSSWQEVGRCEAICQSAFKFDPSYCPT